MLITVREKVIYSINLTYFNEQEFDEALATVEQMQHSTHSENLVEQNL